MDDARLVSWFSRHLVCFYARHKKDSGLTESGFESASGFLLRLCNRLLIVTAAHVLENLKTLGPRLTDFYLFDGIGLDSVHHHGLPFNSLQMPHILPGRGDIGLIGVSQLYADSLLKNDKEAIDEKGWKLGVPDEFDGYFLLGIPSQRVISSTQIVRVGPVLIPLVKKNIDEIHDCDGMVAGAFHAQINVNMDQFSDISGMSGGPIFGIKKDARGQLRYWVVAVQSAWYKQHKIIEGFYVKPLLEELEEQATRVDEEARAAAV